LGSRTAEILEIVRLAVEVQDRAGSGGVAVAADVVQSEDLSFGVRLNPHRETLEARLAAEHRASGSHLPSPEHFLGLQRRRRAP
jgi:hypothetical protein